MYLLSTAVAMVESKAYQHLRRELLGKYNTQESIKLNTVTFDMQEEAQIGEAEAARQGTAREGCRQTVKQEEVINDMC